MNREPTLYVTDSHVKISKKGKRNGKKVPNGLKKQRQSSIEEQQYHVVQLGAGHGGKFAAVGCKCKCKCKFIYFHQ